LSWALERQRDCVFREAGAIGSEQGNVNEGRKDCLQHKHKVGRTLNTPKTAEPTPNSSSIHTAMCV